MLGVRGECRGVRGWLRGVARGGAFAVAWRVRGEGSRGVGECVGLCTWMWREVRD